MISWNIEETRHLVRRLLGWPETKTDLVSAAVVRRVQELSARSKLPVAPRAGQIARVYHDTWNTLATTIIQDPINASRQGKRCVRGVLRPERKVNSLSKTLKFPVEFSAEMKVR